MELVNLKSMATDHDVGYDMNTDNNSPVWVASSLMVELIKGFFSFSLKKQVKSNIYSAAKILMEKTIKAALHAYFKFVFSKPLNVHYMKVKVCHQRYSLLLHLLHKITVHIPKQKKCN